MKSSLNVLKYTNITISNSFLIYSNTAQIGGFADIANPYISLTLNNTIVSNIQATEQGGLFSV